MQIVIAIILTLISMKTYLIALIKTYINLVETKSLITIIFNKIQRKL